MPMRDEARTPVTTWPARVRERMAAPEWRPFAPLNVTPDGRIFRKTRFDVRGVHGISAEWMWVQVDSLDAHDGILTNDSVYTPGLCRGARVTFNLIPEGKPLAGCARAITWRRTA
jgi:hypothetical protein